MATFFQEYHPALETFDLWIYCFKAVHTLTKMQEKMAILLQLLSYWQHIYFKWGVVYLLHIAELMTLELAYPS